MSHHLIDMLPGIIWACFMGLVIGNFATSPIYRLPRKEPLSVRDPYCDDCNAPLKPIDLFPVLSWLMTRGKCRYCGAAVPGAYTLMEAASGALFVLCYLKFGFSEQFLLVSFGMVTFLMLLLMLALDEFFSDRTFIACLMLGTLSRTLQEGTIYGFAGGGFVGLMLGVVMWKFAGKQLVRDIGAYPTLLKLLVAASIWLPLPQFFTVYVAAVVARLLKKESSCLAEWTVIFCTMMLVLIRT